MIQTELFNSRLNTGNKLRFIDLFAGIGGFHLALHKIGANCVFASEIDKYARQTYQENFKLISPELFNNNLFNKDIRQISTSSIPEFHVLCAGFPCQPFSQAGLKQGFNDGIKGERGNLFFVIADILEEKSPNAFILENVRHLIKHNNGKTFEVIKKTILDIGYSFYYKILKASDYGLPQHRPRVFMVGFKNDTLNEFKFPSKKPLQFTMSHVFNGTCNKEIGFTLRVGGKGSGVEDRRNWDCYLVNNEVKKIGVLEAKKLQGFPPDFKFPVSNSEALKQLGNSVAITVVEEVSKQVLEYINKLQGVEHNMLDNKKANKGEWSEFVVMLKLLLDQSIDIYNHKLQKTNNSFKVLTIYGKTNTEFKLINNSLAIQQNGQIIYRKLVSEIINLAHIENILAEINNNNKTTFTLISVPSEIEHVVLEHISLKTKSTIKSDLFVGIENEDTCGEYKTGFSIKSHLGGKSTLINASAGTNFIYEINGVDFTQSQINEINNISTKSKIRDRLKKIYYNGGNISFVGTEKSEMAHNLSLLDSNMANFIAEILLSYYNGLTNSVITYATAQSNVFSDENIRTHKLRKFLTAFALGAFPSRCWNGNESSNGFIILKPDGDMGALHILYREELESYLLLNTFLDTPSSSRNRFGSIFKEGNKMLIKLNLQVRLKH